MDAQGNMPWVKPLEKPILRKTWRKKVHFEGHFETFGPNKTTGELLVKNISTLGIGFAVLSNHIPKRDDTVYVTFTLDDSSHSVIEKEAVVKFVDGKFVGCEFTGKVLTDPVLLNYLKAESISDFWNSL